MVQKSRSEHIQFTIPSAAAICQASKEVNDGGGVLASCRLRRRLASCQKRPTESESASCQRCARAYQMSNKTNFKHQAVIVAFNHTKYMAGNAQRNGSPKARTHNVFCARLSVTREVGGLVLCKAESDGTRGKRTKLGPQQAESLTQSSLDSACVGLN